VYVLAGIGTAAVLVLISLLVIQGQNSSALNPGKSINLTDASVTNGFFMNICGEEDNPDFIGSSRNPLMVKQGQPPAIIQLCIISTNTKEITWQLSAADPQHLNKDPANGIHVSLDKSALVIPAYSGKVSDLQMGQGITDKIDVLVSADETSSTGLQSVMILATGTDFYFGYSFAVDVQK
jgi:hypothetical protein